MIEEKKPMFLVLLETLREQSDETRAMFLAGTEKELMAAYQEGKKARKNRVPIEKNPYSKPMDNEIEKYTKYLCWGEGYIDTFFYDDKKEQ